MALNDTLFGLKPASAVSRLSNTATFDVVNGQLVIDFDAALDEEIEFPIQIPNLYSGGNIDVRLLWSSSSVGIGDVVWEASIERHQDDVTDLSSDSFGTAVKVTATTASAARRPKYTTITMSTGLPTDGIAAGEDGRLLVRRLGLSDANDTMAGDAELRGFRLRESS